MQKIILYSDGSALKNGKHGPAGYGTVVQYYSEDDSLIRTEEFTEGFKASTNNRMELMGIIAGIESIAYPSLISIYSDSRYVVDAFNKKWINNWQQNGWKTSTGSDVKNKDLWERLLIGLDCHSYKFEWVRGHNGNPLNERCDFLATSSAKGILFDRQEDGTLKERKIENETVD